MQGLKKSVQNKKVSVPNFQRSRSKDKPVGTNAELFDLLEKEGMMIVIEKGRVYVTPAETNFGTLPVSAFTVTSFMQENLAELVFKAQKCHEAPEVADKHMLRDELYDIAQELENTNFPFPGISEEGLSIMQGYEDDPYFVEFDSPPVSEILDDCVRFDVRVVAVLGSSFAVPANCPTSDDAEYERSIPLRHLNITAGMNQELVALIHYAKKKK